MKRSGVVAASLLITVSSVGAILATRSSTNSDPSSGVVKRVVDGDTFIARIGNRDVQIRLIGVDTPETVKPGAPVECFGPEASDFTKSMLREGSSVRLARDIEARDKYGRLLAYVYVGTDEVFLNRALIEQGFATAYPYPPNTAHADEFNEVEREARTARLGLWGSCEQPSG